MDVARLQREPYVASPAARGESTHVRDGAAQSTDAGMASYEEFTLSPGPGDDGQPSRRCIEAACAKVVTSAAFSHSARHRSFLNYVVRAALDGRASSLKEVVIGLEVFERALDRYDPVHDPIVRVEARRLRMKLERYYAGEGSDDPVEIRLPVGGYAPSFERRQRHRRAAHHEPLLLVLPFVVGGSSFIPCAIDVGVVEQLTNLFGSQSGIRVVARMVAMKFRERAVQHVALCRTHSIDYVIDGSLVSSGSRIRCIARLSRTRDGLQLWSSRFDFDASGAHTSVDADLLAFQDRIADQLFAAVMHESAAA